MLEQRHEVLEREYRYVIGDITLGSAEQIGFVNRSASRLVSEPDSVPLFHFGLQPTPNSLRVRVVVVALIQRGQDTTFKLLDFISQRHRASLRRSRDPSFAGPQKFKEFYSRGSAIQGTLFKERCLEVAALPPHS